VSSQRTVAASSERSGILSAIICYLLWGFFPVYWKLLQEVSPLEILAHRMLWSCLFMLLLSHFVMHVDIRALFRRRRMRRILLVAGILCTINWGVYIYAINSGHVLQASLGYYINPLLSILIGTIFFHERLTPVQIIATIMAAVGVVYFTIESGSFPWLALSIGLSFALYGAVKKVGNYPAIPALTVESTFMSIVAIPFILFLFTQPGHIFLAIPLTVHNITIDALLVLGGIVTSVPLIFFARAANSIRLSTLGFLQYFTPTVAFALGIWLYGEQFTAAHLVFFSLVWGGLLLMSFDALRRYRGTRCATQGQRDNPATDDIAASDPVPPLA
jgi:chloramphenicol-sensitive protein RarD